MKKLKHRLFSSLLALALILSIIPYTAFADAVNTKTYTGEDIPNSITMSTNSGTLPDGTLSCVYGTFQQPEYLPNVDIDGIKQAILAKFESVPESLTYYGMSLSFPDGTALPADAVVENAKIFSVAMTPCVFSYANGGLTEITDFQVVSEDYYSFVSFKPENLEELKNIVIVEADELTEKPSAVTKTYTGEDIPNSITMSTNSGTLPDGTLSCVYGTFQQPEYLPNVDIDGIKQAILAKFESVPESLTYYGMSLSFPDGTALPADAVVENAKIFSVAMTPRVFSYANGGLTEITDFQVVSEDYYSFVSFKPENLEELKNIVIVEADELTEKPTPDTPEIAPGVYTVTADLFVDGSNNVVIPGLTAYVSNNVDFPPACSLPYNGKLTVKENGDVFVTVNNLNDLFMLAKIDGPSENVEIVDRVIQNVDMGNGYTERIVGVTFKLLDTSGHYEFNDCIENPMIIDEAERVKHMPLWLNVDFANRKPGFDDSQHFTTRTFTDKATGATMTVSSSEPEVIDQVNKAALTVELLTSGAEFEAAEADLSYNVAVADTPHKLYKFTLTADGKEVALTGNTKIGYSLSTDYGWPVIYQVKDGGSEKVKSKETPGTIVFNPLLPETGIFALINIENGGEIVRLSNTDGRFTYHYVHQFNGDQNPSFFGGTTPMKPRSVVKGNDTEWYFVLKDDFAPERGTGAYQPGYTSVTATMPCAEDQHVYLVFDNSICTSAYELDQQAAEPVNGERMVTVDVIPDDFNLGEDNIGTMVMFGLGPAYDNRKPDPEEYYPYSSYILVTDKKLASSIQGNWSRSIDPIYSGKPQTPNYIALRNVEITGDFTMKNAGQYTFTMTPKAGYTWLDGTAAPQTVQWENQKRYITFGYDDETIIEGETPALHVSYLPSNARYGNFVEGENETNAEGFVLPTVTLKPEDLTVGKHTLYPNHGEADNYKFSYWRGFLTVLPKGSKIIPVPAAPADLHYTGAKLVGIPDSPNYTRSGTFEAVEVGAYTATITPNQGCYWADGSQNSVDVTWNILEAESGGGSGGGSHEKPVTSTVTANLFLPGEFNKQVPGLTAYMTNPNNPVQGSGVPTTPVADNAKLKTAPDGTMTLTLKLVNPVFTLQKLGECKNARIISIKKSSDMAYLDGVQGKYDSRISEVTLELLDRSGRYYFPHSDLFPTLINTDWLDMPLTLAVKFDGGKDTSLDSNENADPDLPIPPGGGSKPVDPEKPVDPAFPFTDVAPDSYCRDAVKWAVDKGVTKGATATTFAPEAPCTRAQNVTFLWRAAGCPEPVSSVNPFTDVPSGAFFTKAVLWAVEQGITKGLTDSTFAPNAPCTRGQTVTFLWRLDGCKRVSADNPFADVAQGSYCHDAVLWAVQNGITKGKTASAFAPDETCSRGQIVTFLYRQLGKQETESK